LYPGGKIGNLKSQTNSKEEIWRIQKGRTVWDFPKSDFQIPHCLRFGISSLACRKNGPEENPFFRSHHQAFRAVLRGFQKAGGPPFLDMRPSDVWSPTVAPRSVAAPNCLEYRALKIKVAAVRRASAHKHGGRS
jgi:hypothetical protein